MNATQQVAPGWQRRQVDGKAVYNQVATAEPGYAIAKPIDVQSLATQTIAANNDMVTAILRQMTPSTIDAERTAAQPGLSSPAELAARNTRFKWVIVAVVLLAAITAAGIVSVAYLAGHVDGAGALAAWLVLSGVAGYLSVTYVHHREANLSPEALEGERIRGDYDVSATDAESRQILAQAYADAVRDDAAARRASAESQRAANLAYTQSPTQRQMDYTPVVRASVAPVADDTLEGMPTTPSQATPIVAPDRDLVAMLEAIDRLYADCEQRDSDVILSALPWGNRGDWSIDAKAKADKVLDYFTRNYDTPLVYRKGDNGARWRLNRQAWRRNVARAIIAREWGS
jgi:hypothetical protein